MKHWVKRRPSTTMYIAVMVTLEFFVIASELFVK